MFVIVRRLQKSSLWSLSSTGSVSPIALALPLIAATGMVRSTSSRGSTSECQRQTLLLIGSRIAGVNMKLFFIFAATFLLTGSAAAQYHVYWGDVHGHTALSDGKGSLDEYFAYARDVAKLDFVIVTDHDFGSAAPWRLPREAWQTTQAKADEFTVNGKFVGIAGYEWTSQPKYWTDVEEGTPSERLFPGPPKFYNHKNVYFPHRVDDLFSTRIQCT